MNFGIFRNYLLRDYTELIGENVMPDLLHVVPVSDDTVINGVIELECVSLGQGLVSHVKVFSFKGAPPVTDPTHYGREDGPGLFISCESGLTRTGSVINDQGLNIVVTHPD